MHEFEPIYQTMMGQLRKKSEVPGIENAFETPSDIAQAYRDIRTARENLCARCGLAPDDSDLEKIMDSLLTLEKDIARRMFHYGIQYARQ